MLVMNTGCFDLNQHGVLSPQQIIDSIKQLLDEFNIRTKELSDAQEVALEAKTQKIEAMEKLFVAEQTLQQLRQEADNIASSVTQASQRSLEEAFMFELSRKDQELKRQAEYHEARYQDLKCEYNRQKLLTPEIEYVKAILKEKKLLEFSVQKLQAAVQQLQRDLHAQSSTPEASHHKTTLHDQLEVNRICRLDTVVFDVLSFNCKTLLLADKCYSSQATPSQHIDDSPHFERHSCMRQLHRTSRVSIEEQEAELEREVLIDNLTLQLNQVLTAIIPGASTD